MAVRGYQPKSLMGFIIAISLVAFYFSIASGNSPLQDASSKMLIIFIPIFLIFLFLTIGRNVRRFH